MLLLLLRLAGLGDVKEAVVDQHEDDAGREGEDGGDVSSRPVGGLHVQLCSVGGRQLMIRFNKKRHFSINPYTVGRPLSRDVLFYFFRKFSLPIALQHSSCSISPTAV